MGCIVDLFSGLVVNENEVFYTKGHQFDLCLTGQNCVVDVVESFFDGCTAADSSMIIEKKNFIRGPEISDDLLSFFRLEDSCYKGMLTDFTDDE